MVLISNRYKFIFIKLHRCASTSIEAYYHRYCLSEEQESKHILCEKNDTICNRYGLITSRDPKSPKTKYSGYAHANLDTIKKLYNSDFKNIELNDYIVFCSIRNPYDIVVSLYEVYRSINSMKYITFDDYVKSKELDRYNKSFIDAINKSTYIIKYETMEEDIKHINEILGIVDNNICLIRSYNVHNGIDLRKQQSYKSYYNEITKDIVYKKFEYIVNKFNYQF